MTGAYYLSPSRPDAAPVLVGTMPVPFAIAALRRHGASLPAHVRAALEVRAALAGTVADAAPSANGSRMLRAPAGVTGAGRYVARAGVNEPRGYRLEPDAFEAILRVIERRQS